MLGLQDRSFGADVLVYRHLSSLIRFMIMDRVATLQLVVSWGHLKVLRSKLLTDPWKMGFIYVSIAAT